MMSFLWEPTLVDLYFPALILVGILCAKRRLSSAKKRVAVLVLGDIGRSPRMQHHALSLANEGFTVELLGFGGSQPFQEVLDNRKISILHLYESLGFHKVLPKAVQYIYKVITQSLIILFALIIRSKKCSHIILQNPPGLPAIAVAKFAALLQGSRLIIDWHNYGFSIMRLSHPPNSPILKLATLYEGIFGKLADGNLCVTQAMKTDLKSRWGIDAHVLYDRPVRMAGATPCDKFHDLCVKMATEYKAFAASSVNLDSTSGVLNESAFTTATVLQEDEVHKDYASQEDSSWVLLSRGRQCSRRAERPALLVSSTSWTPDEDFSILLEALEGYDKRAIVEPTLPRLVCAITGKGPQKAQYIEEIAQRNWSKVEVCTPWLDPADYPLLLGGADLGVCLHTSSSGLDLPMKVVDMFGCQLPVLAISFACLSELVKITSMA